MLTVTITNTIMSKTRNAGGGGGIPPSNTVAPVISGTAVVGQTLSSTTGTWIGTPIPTYTYQWYRGANPISGATSSTYTLVQADATFSVTCVVTATNPAGIASATSNALTITDADAQAFFTASGLIGTTNQSAINQLVVDMKGYGIWTKMKAIYPMVGGTAALHKWNLKDPQDTNAAFRLVFNGGWTHSSTGALPNGTNGWANTFLSPSTSLTNNNTHISYYSRTNTSGPNKGLLGASVGGSFIPLFTIYGRSGSNVFFMDSYNYNTSRNQGAEPTGQSFLLNTRTSSTSFKSFRNSTLVATSPNTNTDNVTGINFPISIGGLNLAGTVSQFSDFQCAFSSIGDGLTDTESVNLYTAVQAYNTTLGRNNP